jgi:hypothetical protein
MPETVVVVARNPQRLAEMVQEQPLAIIVAEAERQNDEHRAG